MSDDKNRILSYKLATVLEPEELEKVSGGTFPGNTVGTQRILNTAGGDTTIAFDQFDDVL